MTNQDSGAVGGGDELTYGTYLRIDELLELQSLRSDPPEHDETLFIIIHQVYELWFKQVLHEADQLVHHLDTDRPWRGMHQLKRILKIFKTLVAQLDILETMTPLEFSSFRSFLADASGFQSVQFRELEYAMGIKDPVHLERMDSDRLRQRYEAPTVWDSVTHLLARGGHPIPPSVLERDVTQSVAENAELQPVLVHIYRTDPPMIELLEALTDLDEGLQEWRYRHVKMVQRTIGAKMGTGGSRGADYLRSTLFRPAFPDLWTIRDNF
ncbi:MAG: tryptophan 2,3-dioxygenase [Actinomycetia bacterium]|nr:tryptophan 2,3-dioxygenase [Actinomycetes bacterium]